MRRYSTAWTMHGENWACGATITTMSGRTHRWATKHPLKRAERLSSLRAPRKARLPNRYLRRLLYLGAMAQISARRGRRPGDDWLWRMLEKKPVKVVAVALANRMARVVWALIRTGESYRATPA